MGDKMNNLGIEIELAGTLMDLVVEFKPKSIVEIGTGYGVSTSALLQGVNTNKKGMIYTFDSVVRRPYEWETMKIPAKRLRKFNCEFKDSERLLPGKIDFVFHDAGHFFEHIQEDLGLVWKRIRKGAIIAIHDVVYAHEMGEKVQKMFDGMGWDYKVLDFGCGLGLARKK